MGKHYKAGDRLPHGGLSERVQSRLRRDWGLSPVSIQGTPYLLPGDSVVAGLVAALNQGDVTAAAMLSDYLQERGIPRPPEILRMLYADSIPTRRETRTIERLQAQLDIAQETIRRLDAELRHLQNGLRHRRPLVDNGAKRKAVQAALLDPAHQGVSNREIGRRCGVSEGLVRALRDELSAHGAQIDDAPGEIEVHRGTSVYTMRTR